MRAVLICWGILLLLAGSVQAGTGTLDRTEALLRKIGVDSYLAGFAQEIGGTDNPLARSFTDISGAWSASAAESFAPDAMFDDVAALMSERLTETEIAELEAFYDSRLGRQVTAMEVAAQRPGAARRVETEGAELLRGMIARNDPRLAQLTDLIAALSAVETGLEMAVSLNQAVVSGMAASGRLPFALSDAQIEALVRSQAGLLRGAIREQRFVSLVYTYQGLPDEELARYIGFLDGGVGRDFYVELLAAKSEVIGKRARRFGARLMELQGTESL